MTQFGKEVEIQKAKAKKRKDDTERRNIIRIEDE